MAVLFVRCWITIVAVGLFLRNTYAESEYSMDKKALGDFKLTLIKAAKIGEKDIFSEKHNQRLKPIYHAVRTKRGARFWEIESTGLNSNFLPKGNKNMFPPLANRVKRNVNVSEIITTAAATTSNPEVRQEMPIAEKQTMNNHGTIEEQWTKKPYKTSEFPKVIKEENDSDGEESMLINEGIKSRAPRVNFITQQTKSRLSPTETRDTGSEKVFRELYRKPLASIFYERPLPRDHDSFMAPSQPPLYPPMYPKYHDTFQRDMMDRLHPPVPHRYDQYYERRYDVDYDSYFPRYKFPHYYYYPDKHFDVPLYYRNPNYFYTNEIEIASARPAVSATYNDRLPPSTTVRSTVGPAMRNRRIIYFATLPEIVRPSPNLDMYHRYPIGSMGNKYEPFYSIKTPQPPIAYKNSRPLANDRKDDKYVVSKPIKIIRDAEATRRGRLSMSQEATDSTRSSLRNDGLLLGIQRTYFRGGL